MKITLEDSLVFHLLALFVLVVFYSIYLIKQWTQKRRGIQQSNEHIDTNRYACSGVEG